MANLLTCRAVQKSFGPAPLFDGLSLSVNDGDRIGIIGPNGSGKSTFLKILAQLEPADGGELIVRRDLAVSYLSQQDDVSAGRTVAEVIAAPLKAGGALDEEQLRLAVARTASQVGFDDANRPVSELSGGWRKRLALAAAIVNGPDLLLLDEPTNHLDIEGIQWLERFLAAGSFSVIVISHDRIFLENVTSRMVEINRRFPNGYFEAEGNYSRFLEKREEYLTSLSRHEDALANRVRREMEWLRRGPKARGTKARARIDEARRLIAELQDSQSRSRTKAEADIEFSGSGRRTKQLLVAEGIAKGYGGRPLFSGLDFTLSPGTRLGLVGDNGSGKSTLLRVLAGEIEPDEGTVTRAAGLKAVLFDQGRQTLDPDSTLRRTLAPEGDQVVFQGRALHVASYAAKFLFSSQSLNVPVKSLSGGEQARLLIARLMLQPADILLLDEPTNDLDIDTLDVLEESLEEFPGAVVLVTHDRLMLDRISKLITGLDGGRAALYADCAQWLSERKKGPETAAAKQAARPVQALDKPRKLSYMEKRERETIEARIEEAEAKLRGLEERIAEPEIASDAMLLAQALVDFTAAKSEVDALYERWAELEDKAKGG